MQDKIKRPAGLLIRLIQGPQICNSSLRLREPQVARRGIVRSGSSPKTIIVQFLLEFLLVRWEHGPRYRGESSSFWEKLGKRSWEVGPRDYVSIFSLINYIFFSVCQPYLFSFLFISLSNCRLYFEGCYRRCGVIIISVECESVPCEDLFLRLWFSVERAFACSRLSDTLTAPAPTKR